MKPHWESHVFLISNENFYSLTGCKDARVVRYLLMKYLLEMFDDNLVCEKGFTSVLLQNNTYMLAVRGGNIVEIEFHLIESGVGTKKSWCISFSSLNNASAKKSFINIIACLDEMYSAYENISQEVISEMEEKLSEMLGIYLSRIRYKEYVKGLHS